MNFKCKYGVLNDPFIDENGEVFCRGCIKNLKN